MTEALVVFDKVIKRFGDFTAVQAFDLDIIKGEFLAIMGPSGCGKTTTLRMLAGLERPSEGEIRLNGRRMNEVKASARDTPMVWQNLALFPFLDVGKNVEFGPSLRNLPARERIERTRHYVDAVGLNGFEDAYPVQLSGGMQQRVALARVLANDPQMLLMDEPFGALDHQTRSHMQELLLGIWEREQKTVLFVTHDIDESLRTCTSGRETTRSHARAR